MRPKIKVTEEFYLALKAVEDKLNSDRCRDKLHWSYSYETELRNNLDGEIHEYHEALLDDSQDEQGELVDVIACALMLYTKAAHRLHNK